MRVCNSIRNQLETCFREKKEFHTKYEIRDSQWRLERRQIHASKMPDASVSSLGVILSEIPVKSQMESTEIEFDFRITLSVYVCVLGLSCV